MTAIATNLHPEAPLRARFADMWKSIAVLATAFVLLLGLSMSKRLDHDEHQFIASAALLARRGLLPYRDYPYFHTPYMVFLYALLFNFSDHLLLTARLTAMLCSFGTVSILFFTAMHLFRDHSPQSRFQMAIGTVLIIMANPIFTSTSGRSWNHDLPTFMMLAAMVLLWAGAQRNGAIGAIILGGVLMGWSIGVRLTFAPPALAILPLISIAPDLSLRRRAAIASVYCATVLLALVPALALFRAAPSQFIFGNFEYPRLNTAFRILTGDKDSMTAGGKLFFLFKTILVQPGNIPIVGLLVAIVALACFRGRALVARQRIPISCLIVLLCAALIGSFAPAPLFKMYFFTPLPLIMLLMLYLAAPLCLDDRNRGVIRSIGLASAAISLPMGIYEYRDVIALTDANEWVPLRIHQTGVELASQLPPNAKVLTVIPLFPLEGKCDVFEQFAAGAFPLRVSAMLTDQQESQLHALDDDDLRATFLSRHPRVVLTGLEPTLDRELLEDLAGLQLQKQTVDSDFTLWLTSSAMPSFVADKD